ncbi:MAG: SAM-dependent methyltransferase [Bacteroidota bacterium]|nr:SAM-dependent methyltransferase [Bacteroidota bacterium]
MKYTNNKMLHLLPLTIAENTILNVIPAEALESYKKIKVFISENNKTSRRFLKLISKDINIDELVMFELSKHEPHLQMDEIKQLLKQNEHIGLMSESGMPCIGDPGNVVVQLAHEMGIRVKPYVGPSSILLALVASGFDGQHFKFLGYLSKKPEERKLELSRIELDAKTCTQIFIETPYRNDSLLAFLIQNLSPNTKLMIAKDITGEDETIISQPIKWWRLNPIEIGKSPCIFAIYNG